MKEPLSTCSYNLLYQDLKRFSKNGEYFCKELVTVFQQRSELEISYAKRLQKLAGKLLGVSKTMTSNSTYNAWSLVSNEMFSTAEAHRTLGQSLQQDAGAEIRQMMDEHTKRKRPLENAIEKSRKLVVNNWNEQLKAKKKLTGLTREHEALFSFVEKNKHICTEKEKQKMLNRLSKSAELQVRVDEEYFKMNLDSHHIRLKWENTLKSCYQIVQETEKQRIETLSKAVNKYNLLMSSYSQSLLQSEQQIEDAVRRVDVEKDIQTLVENTCVTADDKAEFLIVDYFEEEGKTVMDKERRRDALKMKLQRLQECILKTRKEKEGLEKIVGVDPKNISQTSEKTSEEHEQLLEEYILKLDILEATYCKLNQSLMDLEGKPKPSHRFNDSITKFTEKEVAHSIARLPRPIRIKRPPFRSRQSFRTSVIFKTSAKNYVNHQDSIPCVEASAESAEHAHRHMTELNGAASRSRNKTRECAESSSVGKCKALYDFSSEKRDELNIKEGDLLDILRKDSSGWWYGELNGKKGHFPYNYVKELPVLKMAKTSDA